MQANESRHREMNASPGREIEKMMNKHADRKKNGTLNLLKDCQLT